MSHVSNTKLDTALEFASIMGGYSPSKYQVGIFGHIRDFFNGTTSQNAIVEAVAGSGKTSTIVAAAKLIPLTVRAAFLAFNTKIAEELGQKLPRHVEAMTLNSLGNRIWGDYIKGRGLGRPVVKKNKVSLIIRDVLTQGENQAFGNHVSFLVKMAKAYGVVPDGYKDAKNANGCSDTPEFWADLVSYYGRDIDEKVYDRVIEATRIVLARNLDDETTIDYDDQLYMPVVKRTEFDTPIPHRQSFGAVFLDEAQDLNPVQRCLVRMIMKKGALLVAVGDRKQAIYGFRGASSDSMEKIENEFNCKVYPLYYTYRCATAIVAHAQEIVPYIEAAPGAKDGVVKSVTSYKATDFKPGYMVICRNNAPLISFAYRLIRCKVKCKVLGRDIGKDLINLIDSVEHNDSVTLLVEQMNEWLAHQIEVIKAKNEGLEDEEAIQAVQDRYDSIMVFVNGTSTRSVAVLKKEIEAMFVAKEDANSNEFVILCTGHKSKGLEAKIVFHLNSHLLYPRYIQPGSWEMAQESNLDYVMRTRAKLAYYYIDSDNMVEVRANDNNAPERAAA